MSKLVKKDHPLITLGSPYGIGYEVFLMSLDKKTFQKTCPVCVGSEKAVKFFLNILKIKKIYLSFEAHRIEELKKIGECECDFLLIDIDGSGKTISSTDQINPERDGSVAYKSIFIAAELVKAGHFTSVTTLPVSKMNINLIDPSFFGHTEFFKERWVQKTVFMTFVSKKLSILLLTTHLPLRKVPRAVTPRLVRTALKNACALKKKLNIKKDIVFLGLNPHAGENGLIGTEDLMISDVINVFNMTSGVKIKGPVPADTAFTSAGMKKTGLYIACYHDQALIPFKSFAFEDGVNLSFGMKYIRTSVDHGTAVDIIGKKKASAKSFIKAYKLAVKLAK